MQRWYEQQEETVRPVLQTVSSLPTERRYDTQTMQKAVQIAARMQAEHQETLTAREIEAIATEAGIQPRFIQQALTMTDTQTIGQRQVTGVRRSSRRRLSRHAKTLIFGAPLLYFFFLFPFAIKSMHGWSDQSLQIFLFLALPALITLIASANLRRTRQGGVTGFLMGLSVFMALFLASLGTGSDFTRHDGNFQAFCWFLSGGTVLGATTTWVRRYFPLWLAGNDELTADP